MIKKLLLVLFITLPIIAHSQFSGALALMKVDTNPEFDQYEKLLFDATEFIFDNPKDFRSKEFLSACKIVDFWKNKDTGINVPVFGSFYNSLNPKTNHQYFYMIAVMNYILSEKINQGRLLENIKIEGQTYSEQEDVRESQLEGAKIFLDYAANKKNNIMLEPSSKKFVRAHKKGKLEEVFFE
ncbi:MAG: hypothetical protein AAF090_07145 [Bacteroidota bacterium]